MIKYRRLRRQPIDEYFHQAMFVLFSLSTKLLPITTELRSVLMVFFEGLMNFVKFLFRLQEDPQAILQDILVDHRQAYPEEQKVAIITGATSGIGKEMAIAVAKAEFHLVLPVRNMPKAERVKDEIIKHTGNAKVTLLDCDLSSLASIAGFVDQFRSKSLPLNLLISIPLYLKCLTLTKLVDNAGVFVASQAKTKDGFEPNIGINYVSHFYLTELLLQSPELRRKGSIYGTRIINITSASFYSGTDQHYF